MQKTNIKNFYIFRHGECPLNQSGHIQGQSINGKLTDKGCKQAHAIGNILKDKKIEIIISSPMIRAIQTAKIVRDYLDKIPIMVDHRLTEVNMGVVEGLHLSLAEKLYKDVYKHWRSNKPKDLLTSFENGETKADVRKRVFAALEYYAQKTSYYNIAVSSHGIVISQIMQFLGVKKSDIPNGSILFLAYINNAWRYNGFVRLNV